MEGKSIGIIGMGDMGKMYTNRLSEAGWKVNACDLPENFETLKTQYASNSNVTIHLNGSYVSRISDYIIYSVEAENIARVVEKYGSSTKKGAIVGGQTSCKAPEIAAFEKFLPDDVEIISIHSLHGPKVNSVGQPLVFIKHRASDESLAFVESIFKSFRSKHVYLTAEKHDMITADTQAVTHVAFLSMGQAWRSNEQYPWEMNRYSGGIENIKINVMLRIYANKWHVYAGLALLNPSAERQVRQYAASVTELFKLMLGGQREEFTARVHAAGAAVFNLDGDQDLLLEDEVLNKFALGTPPPPEEKLRNNHLCLLAMVDSWWKMGIMPYDHIVCSTPLFRLWLGATEYLYRKPGLLNEAIDAAIDDLTFRSDDLEFTFAARGWSQCVSHGDFKAYKRRFEETSEYFAPRFAEATRVGNEMIKTLLEANEKRT